MPQPVISEVSYVIHEAVAPVFLLTGIGSMLSVLINRLGRVVDRFRVIEREQKQAPPEVHETMEKAKALLSRRAQIIYWALGLCTSCSVLICIVIATLFSGSVVGIDLSTLVSTLFIAAMGALVAGLLCFLREVSLAKGNIQSFQLALPDSTVLKDPGKPKSRSRAAPKG
jgi:hypothetical protein